MMMSFRQAEALHRIAFEIEFDEHGGLIAHNPSGVIGFDSDKFRGLELLYAAILEADVDLSLHHETDMGVRTELFAEHGTQMRVPGKTGRIDHALDADGAGARDINLHAADIVMLVGTDRG